MITGAEIRRAWAEYRADCIRVARDVYGASEYRITEARAWHRLHMRLIAVEVYRKQVVFRHEHANAGDGPRRGGATDGATRNT